MRSKTAVLKDYFKWLLNFTCINVFWGVIKCIYRYAHKGVTVFKAIGYYIFWYFCVRIAMYEKIAQVTGAVNIEPFQVLRWKHGTAYFTAEIRDEAVFIKTGGITDTTKREVYAISYAAQKSTLLRQHIPKLLPNGDYVVVTLIKGRSLRHYREPEMLVQQILVSQLYEIYRALKEVNIFHLDIRPDNFLVEDDGNLVLIDFGYALVSTVDVYYGIPKTTATMSILRNLGSSFAPGNGILDDAYSMLLTMKYVCPSLVQQFPRIWEDINKDIGKRVVKLEY